MDAGWPSSAEREASVAEVRRQVRQQFRRYVVAVAVVSLVVGGLIGRYAMPGRPPVASGPLTPPPYWAADGTLERAVVSATATPLPWRVCVTGAVLHPGVVTVPAGSLLADALDAAGGATSAADLGRVNLAASLADNQHVVVPARAAPATAVPDAPSGALVNINTATAEALEALPHIGPALAQRIIDYREAHGPFARKEDLQNVAGIGETRYNDLAPLITVGE